MNEIMLEEGRFTTTGVIDEAFIRTNSRYLINSKYRLNLTVLIVLLMAVGAALAWLMNQPLMLNMTALAPMIGLIRYAVVRKRVLAQSIARLKETAPEGTMTLTTSFGEDGMQVNNEATGGMMTLSYGSIQWVRETEENFLVRTRAGQLSAVFKESLGDAEREELISYLRGKGLQVRTM